MSQLQEGFNQVVKILNDLIEKLDNEIIDRSKPLNELKEQRQKVSNALDALFPGDIKDIDLAVLHGKHQSDISKLRLFMEVFNALAGPDNNKDVNYETLLKELKDTRRFYNEDVKNFIDKAIQNGQIYERRSGVYAKV